MTQPRRRGLVVGSMNADLVLDLPSLPIQGETLLAFDLHRLLGGKGGNQAVALARLGVHTAMVGCVGDDAEGRALLDGLRQVGVGTSDVTTAEGLPSGLAVITVDPQGRNAICVVPGANQQVTPADVDAVVRATKADVVVTQLEIPLASALAALKAARDVGSLAILNAAPAHRLSPTLLSHVDVLVVNEVEAAMLTDAPLADIATSAINLAQAGPSVVVITLGAQGCVVTAGHGVSQVSAMPVDVVDTTGAGDCFVAALAAALIAGSDPVEAARFATAASALAVMRRGAQPGMPDRSEVEAVFGQVATAVDLPVAPACVFDNVKGL